MSEKRRYYHASKTRFKPGEIVHPANVNVQAQFQASDFGKFYMTTSPKPHFTIADRAIRENWDVYEVRPLNPKNVKFGYWDDLTCNGPVEIIKNIGSARSFAKTGKPPKKNQRENYELERIERKQKLKKAKEALGDPIKENEFLEEYGQYYTIQEHIQKLDGQIKFPNPQTSDAREGRPVDPPPKPKWITKEELNSVLHDFKKQTKYQKKIERNKKNRNVV